MTPKTAAKVEIKVKDKVRTQTGLPNDFWFPLPPPIYRRLRACAKLASAPPSRERIDRHGLNRSVFQDGEYRDLVGHEGGELGPGHEGTARVGGEDGSAGAARRLKEGKGQGGQIALIEDVSGQHD